MTHILKGVGSSSILWTLLIYQQLGLQKNQTQLKFTLLHKMSTPKCYFEKSARKEEPHSSRWRIKNCFLLIQQLLINLG